MGISTVDSIMTVIKRAQSGLFRKVLNLQPVAHVGNGDRGKIVHKRVLKSFPILVVLCLQLWIVTCDSRQLLILDAAEKQRRLLEMTAAKNAPVSA